MKKDRRTHDTPMKRSRASVILGVLSAVFITLTVVGVWFMRAYLSDPAQVREAVGEHYLIGGLCAIFISAVQVIVALIPGEMVEIAAGFVFGTWGGALVCTAGIVLGSCTTILLVRRFGRRFVYAFYPKEKLDSLPILREPRKRNALVLLLFLIPGTPKDLFTYAIGLTDMKILHYVLLTTLARFPSVILSTMSGDAMGTQRYVTAIVLYAVTALVSGIGLFCYNRYAKRRESDTNTTK